MRLIPLTTLLVLVTSLSASADLYTGGELSVEWLVDSSDEIVFIQAREVETSEQTRSVSIVRTLKGQTTSAQTPQELPKPDEQPFRLEKDLKGVLRLQFRSNDPSLWRNAGWKGGRSSEWLLFIRTNGAKRWVVKGINLTKPTETSRTSAITADGIVLKQKDQILKHVENRINQQHKLPIGCQRKFIDNWKSSHTHHTSQAGPQWWFEDLRRKEVRLSDELVAQVLGGFAVPIAIEYWDEPGVGDADEDLHLTFAIVPADSRSKAKLMQSIKTSSTLPPFHVLVALLNYPGKETESILQKVASDHRGSTLLANRLLEYLRYTKNPASPLDEQLLGKWRLEGRNETVYLNFQSDHLCSIDVRPTEVTRNNEYYLPIDGKGRWAVHEGKLWIA